MTITRSVPSYLPFEVEVTAVRRLSPSFVRVTFSGPDLIDFDDGGPLGTRDTRVKTIFPALTGAHASSGIDVTDPGWYRRWLARDPDVRGHMRTYTARSARLDAPVPELDIDFVLHLDAHGGGGPATVWAANAQVGQRLTVLGPNRHSDDRSGIEFRPPTPAPGKHVQVLLAGDETALPAIAAILETLPDQYTGTALIEIPNAEDRQHLTAPAGMQVVLLPRAERAAGEQLQAAVEQTISTWGRPDANPADCPDIDVDSGILWETHSDMAEGLPNEPFYAWIAGEAAIVRDIRRSLVATHGIPRRQVAFMGYWRRGRAEQG
jgi:NADPH-dependent ferric siderophore reductase